MALAGLDLDRKPAPKTGGYFDAPPVQIRLASDASSPAIVVMVMVMVMMMVAIGPMRPSPSVPVIAVIAVPLP
jgi:hypothetical protein